MILKREEHIERRKEIAKSIRMKKKFSWKAFISIGLFYSFFILFLTGLALYISPPGRVAHWQEWKFMGFTKENWEAIHVIPSFCREHVFRKKLNFVNL